MSAGGPDRADYDAASSSEATGWSPSSAKTVAFRKSA